MSSFGDLLKSANKSTVNSVENVDEGIAMASMDDGIMSYGIDDEFSVDSVAQVSETEYGTVYSWEAALADEGWTRITDRYIWYDEYSDNNISTIDNDKNIDLNNKQFNITQEENSQFIPFEMPRYYDGFDLSTTTISIHYEVNNKEHSHGDTAPVNVQYNNTKIRFAWLVDAKATQFAGTLKFEIRAIGANSHGKAYVWKSRPNDKLNVLQSLCTDCDELIQLDDSWVQELIERVTTTVTEQIAGIEVAGQVQAAQTAATEAKTAATQAKGYADDAKQAATDAVESVLADYATTKYVDDAIASVDVSDQLANYAEKDTVYTKTETGEYVTATLQNYATKDDVADAISSADLDSYYKKDETYSKIEIDEKVSNVQVDLTGYATETYVNNKEAALNSSIQQNTTNISSLSGTVSDLQETVSKVDISPRKTYDVVYNDTEDPDVGENVFAFYEIENEGVEGQEVREIKRKFTIVGGGGGGTTSSLKIGYVTTSPLVVTLNDIAIIKYTFSGTDSSGDDVPEGTATWKVGGRTVYTNTAINGENSFDVTQYLSVGSQKVTLSIQDEAGSLVTKTWTVQKIDVRLESGFNDKLTYPMGKVSFDYTPYGAISKDVHFILDGEELGTINTASSGIPMAYEIPAQTHGSHLLEAYMTTLINGNDIESNHILKDIIWYDSTNGVPVIGTIYQNFTARQYDTTNIEYSVYDPSTETPTVTITVDGEVVSTQTLDSNNAVYPYKAITDGTHTITIACGETVKTLTATIEKLDIDVEPVTAGLVFDFNPVGKSNNDADRIWSTDTVAMTVSDNFDWTNGGYQIDENGDQYFCIKAGTSAEIDYQLFADDAKRNGKEFKLIFKTANVSNPDARFLHCIDNTTEDNHIGIEMFAHEAYVYGQADKLELSYSENDIVEFEFNINKNTEAVPELFGVEDGVSTRHMVYDDSYNFTQNTPKTITLGSDDCDLHIYRFKVYNASLSARGILSNFIADARNAEDMVDRHNRNQIYDENSQLDPYILAEKCPWLRVYILSAPYFTNNKSDKVPYTTIQQIYKGGDPTLDNWVCYDCSHSGQGTSSNNYGGAARNLDFIMNKSQRDGVKPYFILGDGSTAKKITLTRNSVPVAYLNAKVNVASANNLTNAMLANRYDEFNPYTRPFIRTVDDTYLGAEIDDVNTKIEEKQAEIATLDPVADATTIEKLNSDIAALEKNLASLEALAPTVIEEEIAKIKDTMEFHNCVIFIQETDEDLSTHREFADTDIHFYAIGNIGDSKKSDFSRLTDMSDKYECCVEIMDVELPLSDFPKDTMYNAMGYKEDETTKEKTYIWAKDENLGILYELIDGEYVLTEDTTVDLTKTYYVDILEHDDFSEDFTYGWRYIYEDDDDTENAEVFDYCRQKWIEFYRFVTNSTDEEFKANLSDYFVVDTALYYFLFVNRYCMADNLSKNSFWHYSKTGEFDTDGNPIRKFDLCWGYDMDIESLSM